MSFFKFLLNKYVTIGCNITNNFEEKVEEFKKLRETLNKFHEELINLEVDGRPLFGEYKTNDFIVSFSTYISDNKPYMYIFTIKDNNERHEKIGEISVYIGRNGLFLQDFSGSKDNLEAIRKLIEKYINLLREDIERRIQEKNTKINNILKQDKKEKEIEAEKRRREKEEEKRLEELEREKIKNIKENLNEVLLDTKLDDDINLL